MLMRWHLKRMLRWHLKRMLRWPFKRMLRQLFERMLRQLPLHTPVFLLILLCLPLFACE